MTKPVCFVLVCISVVVEVLAKGLFAAKKQPSSRNPNFDAERHFALVTARREPRTLFENYVLGPRLPTPKQLLQAQMQDQPCGRNEWRGGSVLLWLNGRLHLWINSMIQPASQIDSLEGQLWLGTKNCDSLCQIRIVQTQMLRWIPCSCDGFVQTG